MLYAVTWWSRSTWILSTHVRQHLCVVDVARNSHVTAELELSVSRREWHTVRLANMLQGTQESAYLCHATLKLEQCCYWQTAGVLTLTCTFQHSVNSSMIHNLPLPQISCKSSMTFWAAFVKRFALCYQTICLSAVCVCDVGVFWPNVWMD